MDYTQQELAKVLNEIEVKQKRAEDLKRELNAGRKLKDVTEHIIKDFLYQIFLEQGSMPKTYPEIKGFTSHMSERFCSERKECYDDILSWRIQFEDYEEHNFTILATANELIRWLNVEPTTLYLEKQIEFTFNFNL